MNRKFFARLFLFLVALTGAFSPVFSLVSLQPEPLVVYAEKTTTESSKESEKKDISASGADSIPCGMNVICGGISIYAGLIQYLPHLLAQVSGMILDYAIFQNLQSSTWTSKDSVDSFVVKGWKMMRDFSNLLFIFALFVVGFSLILSGSGSGGKPLFDLDPKRTIARVILMALLINFSFFMCRFIIDVTNLGARVFYTTVTKIDTTKTKQNVTTSENTSTVMGNTDDFYGQFNDMRSVSLGVLALTDAQKLVLGNGAIKGKQESTAAGMISWYEYDWGVYILILFVSTIAGIFNLFLVYLFASSAIFLFARIYGLYFLIILSPIAFVSTVIPTLQKKEYFGFDDWFKQFTGLAFAMPVYMFFIYLALFFMNPPATPQSGYIATAVFILTKLIAAGFVLIMGKKVTKDLSGKIGAMASGAVNGIITGTAMIAGAAMTGGATAALRAGRSVAGNAAVNTFSAAKGVVTGKSPTPENVEAIRNRFNSGTFKNFSRFNNFNPVRGFSNPLRDISKQTSLMGGLKQIGKNIGSDSRKLPGNLVAGIGEAARISGSKLPDQLSAAYRTGKLTPRAERIAEARKKREKKIKDIEFKNDLHKQQLKNPNLTAAERAAINQQIKENQKQIWNLNNPTPAPQNQQNTQQQNNQQNPGAQGGATATNTANTSPVVNGGGAQGASGGTSTPAVNRSVDASLASGDDTNKSPLTPEQTKQIATEIENEMRTLEKEMNEPSTRLNKNRMEELETKYNGLDSERKGLGQGTVLPIRLKSFAGQPVGQPVPKKTFGQGRTDGSLTTNLNLTQQDRVLRKAIENQERTAIKAVAQAKMASKTQSLLAGIANGTASSAASEHQVVTDLDQSGLIETPHTQDFGGMQIPKPDVQSLTDLHNSDDWSPQNAEIALGGDETLMNSFYGTSQKKESLT